MAKAISLFAGLLLISLWIVLATILPPLYAQTQIKRLVIYEQAEHQAELALLSLLRSSQLDSLDQRYKPASQILAEHASLEEKPSLEWLKPVLNKLLAGRCYELFYEEAGEKVVLASSCEAKRHAIRTNLSLPTGLVKEFTLAVG